MNDTEKKLSQLERENDELRLRNEVLGDFIENVPIPFFSMAENGIVTWANQVQLQSLGYLPTEFIGHHVTEFHIDLDAMASILSPQKPLGQVRTRLKAKDGSLKHVIIGTHACKDGKLADTYFYTRDITTEVDDEQKRAEQRTASALSLERIVDSEKLFKSIALNIPKSLIIVFDKNQRMVTIEGDIMQRLGYDSTIFTGRHPTAIPPLAQYEATQNLYTRVLEGEKFTIERKSDTGQNYMVHFVPLFNDNNEVEGGLMIALDISDVKAAEEKSAKLAAIIESSDDAIVSKTLESIITSWNPAAERIFGYTEAEMIGESILKIIPDDRKHEEIEILSRLKRGERIEHFETVRKRKDGKLIHVSLTISPIRDAAGNIIGLSKIARDTTSVKEASERSAKLAAIVNSTDDAIVSKTLESIVTSWNPSAERTFGYSEAEMIGESILKIIPPDRKHEETDILSRLKRGERVEHFETIRQRKDGSLIDVSLTISPVKDEHGKIIGLSKIARDISERKREEQRKNDFVAIVSHELKTPLTSITGYIQLLLSKSRKEGNTQQENILTKAEGQTKKMATMIQEFLDLAKMEDGKLILNKEKFALKDLVLEIIADPQFHSPIHKLEIDVEEHLEVFADRGKIGQVLINLLGNAIKYSPNGGKISVRASDLEGKVKMEVADEGVGVSASNQKRLFDRFYRVNDERVGSVSGFGIGLYLVAEVLRYHQSAIHVQSTEGTGSNFYFTLHKA